MRGPEGKIQDKVLGYARTHDVLYKKNEVGRYFIGAGWPDVIILPDRSGNAREDMAPFFMEFKRPGGKLTSLQERKKEDLEARGYKVFVIDDAEEGRKLIDRMCF